MKVISVTPETSKMVTKIAKISEMRMHLHIYIYIYLTYIYNSELSKYVTKKKVYNGCNMSNGIDVKLFKKKKKRTSLSYNDIFYLLYICI